MAIFSKKTNFTAWKRYAPKGMLSSPEDFSMLQV